MAQPSNFKGEVVAQGGECRKYALWLKLYLTPEKFQTFSETGGG